LTNQPAWELERQILKATHADIAAYLLNLWGLPESVTEAVGRHHEPMASRIDHLAPLAIVHVANHFAHTHGYSMTGASALNMEFVEKLNLASRLDAWRGVIEASFDPASRREANFADSTILDYKLAS
jgi:HD-like signal output (HDOD) protein